MQKTTCCCMLYSWHKRKIARTLSLCSGKLPVELNLLIILSQSVALLAKFHVFDLFLSGFLYCPQNIIYRVDSNCFVINNRKDTISCDSDGGFRNLTNSPPYDPSSLFYLLRFWRGSVKLKWVRSEVFRSRRTQFCPHMSAGSSRVQINAIFELAHQH